MICFFLSLNYEAPHVFADDWVWTKTEEKNSRNKTAVEKAVHPLDHVPAVAHISRTVLTSRVSGVSIETGRVDHQCLSRKKSWNYEV